MILEILDFTHKTLSEPTSYAIAPLLIGAIISAVAALAGGVTNAVITNKANRKNTQDTLQAQKDLQEDAQQFDVDMWNQQNEYNTPIQQYQRYADAGINPASMFGSGSSVAASSVSSNMATAPQSPPVNGVDLSSLLSIIPTLLDSQRVQNETKIANAQAKALEANAGLTTTQTESLKWDNEHKQEAFDNNQRLINAQIDNYCEQTKKTVQETATLKENLKWLGQLNEKQLEQLQANIDKTLADIDLTKAQTNTEYFKQVEASWRADCYSKGINPDDGYLDKLFTMLIKNPNDVVDIFKRLFSCIKDNVTSPLETIEEELANKSRAFKHRTKRSLMNTLIPGSNPEMNGAGVW